MILSQSEILTKLTWLDLESWDRKINRKSTTWPHTAVNILDTAPKKARKERMEAEMKQLERDIETIEKHKVIYIANPLF